MAPNARGTPAALARLHAMRERPQARVTASTEEMEAMDTKKLTRRALLERGTVLSLVVLGASAGLVGCGAELDCTNPPGLTDAQRQQRRALSYADRAPNPSQRCEVCNFYTAPEAAGQCGGCSLNLGAVNPQGYCSSFVARS
jgi:hypothetical protein